MRRLVFAALALVLLAAAPWGASLADMYPDASNAKLPDAVHNLGLQTPAACDGFVEGDDVTAPYTFGASMTAASAVLTTYTSPFTSASVGKKISVRKAGARYFMTKATVSVGGAGHLPGDTVTFPDGVKVLVVATTASPGAVTAFYPIALGSSATSPATLAQIATADPLEGAGTGLVIAPTWIRENLVTTIAGYTSANQVTLAASASATVANVAWGFGTDYGPQIQAAIAAGQGVKLPRGVCGHAQTLSLPDKTVLVGEGVGIADAEDMTGLLWLGAPGGVQIEADGAGTRVSGIEFGGFALDGLGASSTGLRLRGTQMMHGRVSKSRNHTTVALDLHATTGNATRLNQFDYWRLEENMPDLSTHGMWWGIPNNKAASLDGQDASRNQFLNVDIALNGAGVGVGLLCGVADHNTVMYLRVTGSATSYGVDLLGGNSDVQQLCRNNVLWGVDAGAGGFKARATNYTQPSDNIVGFYDRGNGAPVHLVDNGAILSLRDSLHRHDGLRLFDQTFANRTYEVGANYGYPMEAVRDLVSDLPGATAVGGGSKKGLVWNDQGTWRVMTTPGPAATMNVYGAAPAGTTSTTAVMMGLGAAGAVISPSRSGTIVASISGDAANSNLGNGGRYRLRYGTGAPPANGAAQTGVVACTAAPNFFSATAGQQVPIAQTCLIQGAALGVPLWIDSELQRTGGGGTVTLTNVQVMAVEQ